MNEIRLLLKRVFKRVDMMARSLITLIDPGSCFAGTLAELVFAADRVVMFAGTASGDNQEPGDAAPVGAELLRLPDGQRPVPPGKPFLRRTRNSLRRRCQTLIGEDHWMAETAEDPGLITFAYDETDWDDEVRQILEERASFSARRVDRPGSQPPLRRPRDNGNPHFRPPYRLAELDLPATQRRG